MRGVGLLGALGVRIHRRKEGLYWRPHALRMRQLHTDYVFARVLLSPLAGPPALLVPSRPDPPPPTRAPAKRKYQKSQHIGDLA